MSEMKMSEYFPEAFQVDHNNSFEVQDATWYSYGEKYESNCDQDSAFGHAVLNHDRMVEEIAELKASLREARGALSACSIQESRSDGSENRMKINALDKQVNEIDDLLAKLNQEGEE